MSRFRFPALLPLLAVVAVSLAACGAYATEAKLNQDIRRYALGG
jgi:hypothetical protein